MSKLIALSKKSYIVILLALFYIPLLVAAVFSFNADPKKGSMSFATFTEFSTAGWSEAFLDKSQGIINSFLIAVPASLIVIVISLVTVYGLWRQKAKVYKAYVDGSSAIPLINPDIITAICLMLTFGTLFGELEFGATGYVRTVIAHITMIMPFIITIMYPRSAKFQKSMIEASKDLGFGPVRTWFRTYLFHMIPVIAGSFVISMVLSLDDFIITRLIYGGQGGTIGTNLYSSNNVKAWTLAIGTSMLGLMAFVGLSFWIYRFMKTKRKKI